MGRISIVFVGGALISGLLMSGPYVNALAQDAQKKPARVQTNPLAGDLKDAQKRIERLEAQIIEMQAMIGALQTLVRKRVSNVQQNPIVPQGALEGRKVQNPDYQTQGWNVEDGRETNSQNNWLTDDPSIEGAPPSSARLNVNGAPRKLYDAGYNYLISNDYASAETTFKTFLRNYPQDELSGNAQYWLGETFFARGDYRQAANEFLKGYKSYKQSQKGPDNLLKLGMSLHRLGQSEAACQTYTELKSKYSNLPGHVMRHLSREQKAAAC